MKSLISIIIPTYKRTKYLIKILDILVKKNHNFKKIEIIICDSEKIKKNFFYINKYKRDFKNISIKYFNIKRNNHSMKRNIGIKESSNDFLIFLDDDCFPRKNFINQYYKVFKEFKTKAIFCGSVIYDKKDNAFLRYRDGRHFKVKSTQLLSQNYITPDKIVTMNMGFNINKIGKKYLFNENFNHYGFEDYEFAFRQSNLGIKIIKCPPLILHHDTRSFEKYLSKMIFLGEEGMKYLIKINYEAAKKINYFKLENNFLVKNLLKYKVVFFFLNFISRSIVFIEKKIKIPNYLIKLGIVSSYLIGCFLRINNDKLYKKINWYV